MKNFVAVALAIGLAGCSLFQPNPTADQAMTAFEVGDDVGDIACTAVVLKAPKSVDDVRMAMIKAEELMANHPDATLKELQRLVGEHIDDVETRELLSLALRRLERRLKSRGIDISLPLHPEAPIAVGTKQAITSCLTALGEA